MTRGLTSALEPPRTQPCCLSMSSSSSARRLRTCAVACTHAAVSAHLTVIPNCNFRTADTQDACVQSLHMCGVWRGTARKGDPLQPCTHVKVAGAVSLDDRQGMTRPARSGCSSLCARLPGGLLSWRPVLIVILWLIGLDVILLIARHCSFPARPICSPCTHQLDREMRGNAYTCRVSPTPCLISCRGHRCSGRREGSILLTLMLTSILSEQSSGLT